MKLTTVALRIAAVLWLIWGFVHAFAGVMTIANPAANGFTAIADGVDPALLQLAYPDAVEAILNQHGWNLLWGGVVTMVCAPLIWKGKSSAIFLAALVGGMLDVGYFVFLDLGGFVNFVPGTIMTLFSGTAIVLSAYAHFARRRG